ncbi:hypothetical protein BS50DRAFT_96501 [Corynespora cassiicola Philippines]|uniref:Zn(2)-C6 fungal-type domain-containing protein n=1 Tax=Corynespora cassiicola Philippines TaxID=1448308 RepID=A0A2T2NF27_CORCC|nr:hypothetical protein BS50DRAFT_96501 [Corynespora cassiicola Philippines]
MDSKNMTADSAIKFPSARMSRRSGTKVKTGCKPCKLRRVKCDEAKPECSKWVYQHRPKMRRIQQPRHDCPVQALRATEAKFSV